MKRMTWLAAALAVAFAGVANAATVTLSSQNVKTVVTDRGVMSSLIFDPTGMGVFDPDTDYVDAGIEFEGFAVRVGTSSFLQNSNSGWADISGTTVAVSGGALWSGQNAMYSISHLFFFNAADQRVNITTTLTALSALSDVRVSRAVDPDPDNRKHGTADTNNQRGISGQSVPTSDFVGSLGSVSGLPLGLYYKGPIAHNTGIVNDCCSETDPDNYLAGGELGDSSSGDHGIGIGFDLGDLASGQTVSWTYAYVMGGSLGTIDIPGGGGTVPEPTSLALIGLALAGAAAARRRKA